MPTPAGIDVAGAGRAASDVVMLMSRMMPHRQVWRDVTCSTLVHLLEVYDAHSSDRCVFLAQLRLRPAVLATIRGHLPSARTGETPAKHRLANLLPCI